MDEMRCECGHKKGSHDWEKQSCFGFIREPELAMIVCYCNHYKQMDWLPHCIIPEKMNDQ